MTARITPRPIPPTITHGSGLSREWVNGSLHTASGDVKGRYWLALLVGICVLVAVGAAAVGG